MSLTPRYKKKGNILYLKTNRITRNKLIKRASLGIVVSIIVLICLSFSYLVLYAVRP